MPRSETIFPPKVRDYFDRTLLERSRPFCVELDSALKLRAYWGDGEIYGLSPLIKGEDWAERAPFLSSRRAGHAEVIPYFHCENDAAAHVHVIYEDACVYLLYLDATRDMERRRHDQQLANETRLLNHRQSQILEDLVEATAELDTRRREAEESDRIKGRFIASMTHEFRTPLTAVIGYSELLSEKCDDDPELTTNVNAVRRAAKHLLALTDNILDQAKLERGAIDLHTQATAMRDMLADVTAIFAPLAAEKGLGFGAFLEDRVPGSLVTDPLRLRQIFVNLVGNAVKFTVAGEVTLRVDYEDGELLAVISDTGPGIVEDDQQRIFRAFERVKRDAARPGAGLGLAITMRLVRLLGGELNLDSKPGSGSRFSVRIPAAVAPETLQAYPVADSLTPVPDGGGNVLVAEDNPDISRLLEIYFERAGIPLTLVGNGQAAIDEALARPPDVVILDMNMPVMGGMEAVRVLRASGYSGPVLALTASRGDEERNRALEAGFTDFLSKPMDMPSLIDRVRAFVDS